MMMMQGAAAFGLALFAELAKERDDMFFSPYSVHGALALVEAGTTPGSAHEAALKSVLGGATPSLAADDESVQLVSARAVFVKDGIHTTYVTRVKEVFGALASALPSTAAPINEFVAEATRGKIARVVDDAAVQDPLTQAILVDALYFKGSWARQFDSSRSKPGQFKAPGGPVDCVMMSQKATLSTGYLRGLGDAVALDYAGGDLRAVFVLPDDEADTRLEKAAAALAQGWADLRPTEEQEVIVEIPRMNLLFGPADLMPALKKMGLAALQDEDGGFLRMADRPDLHLSNVLHTATIELNEEGTVAAAATAAVMRTRSLPIPPPVLRFDRPFLFLIETKDGLPIFMGKVINNVQNKPPAGGPN